MLFNISRRYRKNSFVKTAEVYMLFVKWGNKGVHSFHSKYASKEEAIEGFSKLLKHYPERFGRKLNSDYRVKRCVQEYTEECITVPTFKELETKLPELKGLFVD